MRQRLRPQSIDQARNLATLECLKLAEMEFLLVYMDSNPDKVSISISL